MKYTQVIALAFLALTTANAVAVHIPSNGLIKRSEAQIDDTIVTHSLEARSFKTELIKYLPKIIDIVLDVLQVTHPNIAKIVEAVLKGLHLENVINEGEVVENIQYNGKRDDQFWSTVIKDLPDIIAIIVSILKITDPNLYKIIEQIASEFNLNLDVNTLVAETNAKLH